MAKAVKADPDQPTAFCMKTKEKNVIVQDAVIDINNNRYIVKGHDGKGNKVTTISSKEKAEKAVAKGFAKWGKTTTGPKKKVKA